MPVFNVSSHLGLFKNCIFGLRNQTFSNWELVIAFDGGASEKDIETATSYFGKGIRQKNKAICVAAK